MSCGFDCGTYNLVCCRRDPAGNFVHKHEVNAFLKISLDKPFVFNMMKQVGVPLIERKDAGVAYALGEAAVNMAYTMSDIELRRPMSHGCLNPKEKSAQQIMSIMMYGLLGDTVQDGETLYYSVPANAINEETDADYHSKVLEAIFKGYKDKNGNKVKAKEHYISLVRSNFNQPSIYSSLSSIYKEDKDTLKAIKTIENGRKKFPESYELIIAEANIYLFTGDAKKSQNALNQAIAKDPTNASVHFAVGNNYEKFNDFANAELGIAGGVQAVESDGVSATGAAGTAGGGD